MTQLALDALGGSGYFLVLTATIAVGFVLSWRAWVREPSADRRMLWMGSAGLLGAVLLWAALSVLFRLGDVHPRLWMAPFDRLFVATCVVALGWSVVAPSGERRWRAFLAAAMASTVAVYAGWAPLWAREAQRRTAILGDPTGLAGPFDLWQAALAVVVIGALLRRGREGTAWAAFAVGLLAAGSAMNLAFPAADVPFPPWSRLGALAAALTVALAAGMRSEFPGPALSMGMSLPATLRRVPRSVSRRPPMAEDGGSGPDLGLDVGADLVVGQMLRSAVSQARASSAFAGLLTPAGQFDLFVLRSPRDEPERVGAGPLDAYPSLQRVLGEGRVVLDSGAEAPDLAVVLGSCAGRAPSSVLLLRVGTDRPLGILGIERRRGSWDARTQARLRAVGRRAAASLEAIGAERDAVLQASRAVRAVEAHGAALTRLTHTVDDLAGRMVRLESSPPAAAESAAPPGTATPTPSDAPTSSDAPTPSDEPGTADGPAPADPTETSAGAAANGRIGPSATPAPPVSAPGAATPGAAVPLGPSSSNGSLARGPADMPGLAARISRYEGVLDRVPWGVVIADADGRVAFANDLARSRLRCDAKIVGVPLSSLFPLPERVSEELRRLSRPDRGAPESVEIRFADPDVRVELELLRDGSGGVLGAVAEIHAGGAHAAEQAMIPAAADALRAPIASLLGYSELLASGGGMTGEQLERFLQRIDANLLRMQVMLGNLGAIVELDGESEAAVPAAVDLERALQRALHRARPHMGEKALDLNVDWPVPLPAVAAEPAALDIVLDNLLVNAAQRSPQGGDVRLTVDVRDDGAGHALVVLAVQDRGRRLPGVPGTVLELDDAAPGSVALRLVRLLAARHGGRAWARPEPAGASFCVRLPLWDGVAGDKASGV